jgi:hypothetical protein
VRIWPKVCKKLKKLKRMVGPIRLIKHHRIKVIKRKEKIRKEGKADKMTIQVKIMGL